jgi:hypothetical protein
LQHLVQQEPNKYVQQMIAPNTHVWCYIKEPHAPWKIFLHTNYSSPLFNGTISG